MQTIMACCFERVKLATLRIPPIYPMIDNNEDIRSKSFTYYSNYTKSISTASYFIDCNIINMLCLLINNHNYVLRFKQISTNNKQHFSSIRIMGKDRVNQNE